MIDIYDFEQLHFTIKIMLIIFINIILIWFSTIIFILPLNDQLFTFHGSEPEKILHQQKTLTKEIHVLKKHMQKKIDFPLSNNSDVSKWIARFSQRHHFTINDLQFLSEENNINRIQLTIETSKNNFITTLNALQKIKIAHLKNYQIQTKNNKTEARLTLDILLSQTKKQNNEKQTATKKETQIIIGKISDGNKQWLFIKTKEGKIKKQITKIDI